MKKFFWDASNIYTSAYITNKIPPSPHFVPGGEGFTKSARPTVAPSPAAFRAHDSPPDPPPITNS